jgi:hypothetical protein
VSTTTEDRFAYFLREHRETHAKHYGLNGPGTSAWAFCKRCNPLADGIGAIALIGTPATPDAARDHRECTAEQIATEFDAAFSAGDGSDVDHYLRLIRLLGIPAGGAGMVSEHEWDEHQFEAYQGLIDGTDTASGIGMDLEWVDTLFDPAVLDDEDYAASETYIEAEQRLALLADHDEACSYTLKATSLEVRDHLLAIIRGTPVSMFERAECYRLSTSQWAANVRESLAARGRPRDVSSRGEGREVAGYVLPAGCAVCAQDDVREWIDEQSGLAGQRPDQRALSVHRWHGAGHPNALEEWEVEEWVRLNEPDTLETAEGEVAAAETYLEAAQRRLDQARARLEQMRGQDVHPAHLPLTDEQSEAMRQRLAGKGGAA